MTASTLGASLSSSAALPVTTDRLRSFVDSHYSRLWRVLRRLGVPGESTEDAAQEVLLVFARKMESVAPKAEWAFVYATARRVASDARRRARDLESIDGLLERREDPRMLAAFAQADSRRLLDALLDELPDPEREAIVLVELEGMTMNEAAELIGVPQGTVASRLRRGREHLEATSKRVEQQITESRES
jgi:RNA polymerase sigma-70 factor, ECF subfamily